MEHPDVLKVIETVIRIALDDNHKNQTAAQKILMDRMLPISTFEKAADNREKINIVINTIRPEKEAIEGGGNSVMRKIDIQDLIQQLGMVGIIGSLIFVGLEMRQSQRIAMAGQQMDRTAIATSFFGAFNEAGLDWHSVALLNRPGTSRAISSWNSSWTK